MNKVTRGFSPIYLLFAAILVIGGGAYLFSQGNLPGSSGMKEYSDPQGIYTVKVPSSLSTYASLSPGRYYAMSETLIAGISTKGWSTFAEIALVDSSNFDTSYSLDINSAKTKEQVSIGGTSGNLWNNIFPRKGLESLNEFKALSGPIPKTSYRLLIMIHNVTDKDVSKYTEQLRQMAGSVTFK